MTDTAASSSMETESTAPVSSQPQIDANGFIILADGNIKKKILVEGHGAAPTDGSEVKVHYVGTLPEGTEFDSSRSRNDPFKFKIGRGNVIKGWDQGVATMKLGEKSLLICSPEYAYGANGAPPKIPPNATLHFEVELLDFDDSENVTDDGKIKKSVKRKGEGYQKPADNTTVLYKYRLAVKQGAGSKTVEDKWNEETKLVIGDDPTTLSGLEESLKNMYKGEHSLFVIQPEYGYGAKGQDSIGIPPNATLLLEIDLVSFEKYKETWDMSTEEKIAYMAKCKEQGNRFFKAGEVKKAGKKYSAAVKIFQYERNLSEVDKKKVDEIKLHCHSNLCVCKAKESNWEKVISNANDGLAIQPNYLKCLFKRAQALTYTDRFAEAEEDFKKCLVLDGKNAEILKAHQELKARILKLKEKERKVFGGLFQKVRLTEEDGEEQQKKKRKDDMDVDKKKQKKEQLTKSEMDTESTAKSTETATQGSKAAAADQY